MVALAAISASPRLNALPENSVFVTKSAQIAFIAPSVFGYGLKSPCRLCT